MTPFLLILLLFIAAVAIIDWIPLLHTWQSRIKIGQFPDHHLWSQKIVRIAVAWLDKTPTIKVTDNTRVIIIDMLRGHYKKASIQSWQKGALLLGLTQYLNQNKDQKVRKQLDRFVSTQFDGRGNWKAPIQEVDEVLLAYAISKSPGFDCEANAALLHQVYDFLTDNIGTDGTIMYRKSFPDYRLVDTLGFVCPFLVRYGLQYDKPEAVALGLNQIRAFNRYAMQQEACIPCHSYALTSQLAVGLYGWGRGLGWYAIGLMDSWLEMPAAHPDKSELTQMIIRFTKMAVGFQKKDGSWSWIVMSPEKQSDASATAILSWFLAQAAQIPEVEMLCVPAKNKALDYLKKVTRRNGALDFSQGDTKGIGVYSQKFDILPLTQGFCLRALYADSNEKQPS